MDQSEGPLRLHRTSIRTSSKIHSSSDSEAFMYIYIKYSSAISDLVKEDEEVVYMESNVAQASCNFHPQRLSMSLLV